MADALLEHSERQRASLLVLGSTTKAGPGESVAQRLTWQASCPVLTVPASDLAPAPRVTRILIVLQPAPTAGPTVEWAALWARRFGASVQLIYREGSQLVSVGNEALCRHDVEETLRRASVRVDASFTEAEAGLGARIAERAQSGSCDLIVMSTARREEGERQVLACVRETAAQPVLTVREFTPDRRFVESTAERELANSHVGSGG